MPEENTLEVSHLTKIYGREMTVAGRTFGRRVVGARASCQELPTRYD